MNVCQIIEELYSSGGWFFVIPASVESCQIVELRRACFTLWLERIIRENFTYGRYGLDVLVEELFPGVEE